MALLKLGAGGATFVGPAIASLFFPLFGAGGVTIIFAALYVASIVLTMLLKVPSKTDSTAAGGAVPAGATGR